MRKYQVVFVGYIATEVEAENEAAAVALAKSLNEFRSDDGRFPRGVLWVVDLTEQEEKASHEVTQ